MPWAFTGSFTASLYNKAVLNSKNQVKRLKRKLKSIKTVWA